jgi:single-strand DNA-binding protein
MTIAVNRRRSRGKESVAFVPLKALGKIAEVAHTYLQKGSGLMVEGRLETRSYEKDGQRRYFTEVLVNELQMLPKSSNGTEPSSASEDEIEDDQEIEDEPI